MKNYLRLFALTIISVSIQDFVCAQDNNFEGGAYPIPANTECVSAAEKLRIHEMLTENIKVLKEQGKLLLDWGEITSGTRSRPIAGGYIWPIRTAASAPKYKSVYAISNYVDLDLNYPNFVEDYNCGTRTYDLNTNYNHGGIDIFTWPFGQIMQEENTAEIIAAVAGTIIGKDDGNYDKNCAMGATTPWNAVYIGADDGTINWYGHMKNGSLTSKRMGDRVAQGEFLGIVGSSGNSTGPHLHFETHDVNSEVIEPFEGACNNFPSLWVDQEPYYKPTINAIMTHRLPPVFRACPQLEIPNIKNQFEIGDKIYFATYLRDYQINDSFTVYVYTPDGGLFKTWTHTATTTFIASYWYWYHTVDATWPQGLYKYKVVLGTDSAIHNFRIGPEDVGIQNSENAMKISIFPNPTSDQLFINWDGNLGIHSIKIEVLNTLGQVVQQAELNSKDAKAKLILRAAPGIYQIRIKALNNSFGYTKKIVIL